MYAKTEQVLDEAVWNILKEEEIPNFLHVSCHFITEKKNGFYFIEKNSSPEGTTQTTMLK